MSSYLSPTLSQTGKNQNVSPYNNDIEEFSHFQAEIQFTKMDANQDGIVTKQEFLNYCLNNPTVIQSMCVLP